MGKSKRQKLLKPSKRKQLPSKFSSKHPTTSNTTSKPPKKHKQHHHQTAKIPFAPTDRILLVGEGDLSFACSLIEHHGCTNVTATVYESSLEELREKYPGVEGNVETVERGGGGVRFGLDVTRAACWGEWRGKRARRDGGKDGVGESEKESGRGKGVDRIVFNFPHVGGKSTDVNRQVRYNQELLVSFFTHAIPTLSPRIGSSIIVTIFEAEPYTLWNIRDLARHSGLEVKESFKFQAAVYPGYKHARTLGVVRGREGEFDGERRGWKGEERAARSYVFVKKGEGGNAGQEKRKRKRGESLSGSDSETSSQSDKSEGEELDDELEEQDEGNSDNGWNGIHGCTNESKEDDHD